MNYLNIMRTFLVSITNETFMATNDVTIWFSSGHCCSLPNGSVCLKLAEHAVGGGGGVLHQLISTHYGAVGVSDLGVILLWSKSIKKVCPRPSNVILSLQASATPPWTIKECIATVPWRLYRPRYWLTQNWGILRRGGMFLTLMERREFELKNAVRPLISWHILLTKTT